MTEDDILARHFAHVVPSREFESELLRISMKERSEAGSKPPSYQSRSQIDRESEDLAHRVTRQALERSLALTAAITLATVIINVAPSIFSDVKIDLAGVAEPAAGSGSLWLAPWLIFPLLTLLTTFIVDKHLSKQLS